jgi:C4-dicarboxylate transporter, DctQ subunit
MKVTKSANLILDKIIDIFAVTAAVFIVLDAFAIAINVIARYTADVQFAGLFEITEYTLLWMPFLGTAWLLRKEGHVRMDAVLTRLSPKPKAAVSVITYVVICIMMAVVIWYSAGVTISDFRTHYHVTKIISPVKWPIEMIIPIGSFVLFLVACRHAYGYFKIFRSLTRVPEVK